MFPVVFFDAACTEQTVRLVRSSVDQGLDAEARAVRRRRLRLIGQPTIHDVFKTTRRAAVVFSLSSSSRWNNSIQSHRWGTGV